MLKAGNSMSWRVNKQLPILRRGLSPGRL